MCPRAHHRLDARQRERGAWTAGGRAAVPSLVVGETERGGPRPEPQGRLRLWGLLGRGRPVFRALVSNACLPFPMCQLG